MVEKVQVVSFKITDQLENEMNTYIMLSRNIIYSSEVKLLEQNEL